MEQSQLNWIEGYLWRIADDVLRDLYIRGKYRDVILPMTVLRRLDAVLEPTKQVVLDMKTSLDKAEIVHQDQALRQAAGQAFYNTSNFTFEETEQSKIFKNAAFGYWKVTVERPLRLVGADPNRIYKAKELKELKETAEHSENAPLIIKKVYKKDTVADPLRGLFETTIDGKPAVVEYEPETDLRDTEQIPLLEEGGIEAFLKREVLPHAADA